VDVGVRTGGVAGEEAAAECSTVVARTLLALFHTLQSAERAAAAPPLLLALTMLTQTARAAAAAAAAAGRSAATVKAAKAAADAAAAGRVVPAPLTLVTHPIWGHVFDSTLPALLQLLPYPSLEETFEEFAAVERVEAAAAAASDADAAAEAKHRRVTDVAILFLREFWAGALPVQSVALLMHWAEAAPPTTAAHGTTAWASWEAPLRATATEELAALRSAADEAICGARAAVAWARLWSGAAAVRGDAANADDGEGCWRGAAAATGATTTGDGGSRKRERGLEVERTPVEMRRKKRIHHSTSISVAV
jgi:hypothetical protein